MNKARIIDIIQKNLLSVICGVLVLGALISLLFPLSGMYHTFQAKLDARTKDLVRANALISTPRFLPIVQSGNVPKKLDLFPNKWVIQQGQAAKDKVQRQSVELQKAAEELNRIGHPLLLANSLPSPGDVLFDFVKAYKGVILIPPTGDTSEQRADNLPKLLGSVMPPDDAEVDAIAKQIKERDFESRILKVGGVEVNRPQIEQEFKDRVATLPEELRQQRAKGFQLYMDRSALSMNSAILESTTPKPSDVWFAQLALWIESDVAGAIVNANFVANAAVKDGKYVKAQDANILNDPVKRLVRIEIPMDPSIYVLDRTVSAPATPGVAAAPVVAKQPGETGYEPDFSQSPTGRTCNPLYDVCRFTLTLVVDQRQIPLILDELQRDKLMSVYDLNIVPVDTAAAMDQGFVYGNTPVVELRVSCEALFMRSWTVAFMPPEIKTLLQVPDAPTTPK